MALPASIPERETGTPWLRPELIAPWWEIALVLAVMLGPFAYSSLHQALRPDAPDFVKLMMTDRQFLRLGGMEGGLLALFFFYLRWRGWKVDDFQIRIDGKGTLAVPLLIVLAGGANIVTALALKVAILWLEPHPHGLLANLAMQTPKLSPHSIDVAWVIIVAGPALNAYLEELVFMGYAFHQFAAKRGPLFALLAMIGLRMLLHTYKGVEGMVGIGAFSLVYGLAYWYLRRLWPLILGHACIDVMAFGLLKIIFG